MLAAQIDRTNSIRILDYPLRELADDELLIKVYACGVCGTDFHIYKGESYSVLPVIPGHEYAGTVEAFGKNVTGFKQGDIAAVDPNIYCGYCSECRNGQVQFCKNHNALGVTVNGGFAEYSIVPSKQAYKLPSGFPLLTAAYAEPLSCCLRGIDRAGIKPGDKIAIIGGGTIGLLMLQLAQLSGSSEAVVFEPQLNKQKIAFALGADICIDPYHEFDREELLSGGGGFDVVIECAGNSEAAALCIELVKPGGTAVLFGLSGPEAEITINLQKIFRKEITIKTSFINPFTFGRAVEMLKAGKVKVDILTSAISGVQKIAEILSSRPDPELIKCQVII